MADLSSLKGLSFEELQKIDPERIDIGTHFQDCVLIAQTFERAANSIPSEGAVFSILTRSMENTKTISTTAASSLRSYLKAPQETSSEAIKQAQQFASDADTGVPIEGTGAVTEHSLQSINIGDTQQATLGDSFGDKLLDQLRDCIPCFERPISFFQVVPFKGLLATLKENAFKILANLQAIGKLFTDFDAYGDFCELLNLLSFMCVPDLQRIIALLMALFMFDLPNLNNLIGFLQTLIAPMFMPILMAITALLDQFVLIITNPLQCVIDAINGHLSKLGFENVAGHSVSFEFDPFAGSDTNPLARANEGISTGLETLGNFLAEGKEKIQNKLEEYVSEAKALLGSATGQDASLILGLVRKLKIVRLIAFVKAMITALAKGHAACSPNKPMERQELDSFFNNFLNPNSPFNMWIDDDGNINIDEKIPDYRDAVDPPIRSEVLPNIGNVFEFEGVPIVNSSLATAVDTTVAAINQPVRAVMPCKLEVTAQDADKVNQFIRELNQL